MANAIITKGGSGGGLGIELKTYTGNGSTENTITFESEPKVVFLGSITNGLGNMTLLLRPLPFKSYFSVLSSNEHTVSFDEKKVTLTSESASGCFNTSDKTYYAVALY